MIIFQIMQQRAEKQDAKNLWMNVCSARNSNVIVIESCIQNHFGA
ncbi:hypothetical protein HMPREF1985_00969 [Mitsuokella sp. oral taxon 131 str. W9106]|nr:hypothetical protein HMPREF1985_00969 [Mitsuokella sp. oral taxon 131 str. W9106]